MIIKEDEFFLKEKQKELNLSNEECNYIIEYLKVGLRFTDAQAEFEGHVLDILSRETEHKEVKCR